MGRAEGNYLEKIGRLLKVIVLIKEYDTVTAYKVAY